MFYSILQSKNLLIPTLMLFTLALLPTKLFDTQVEAIDVFGGVVITPAEELTIKEGNSSTEMQVVLVNAPTEPVTVIVESSDEDVVTANTPQLVFDSTNWSQFQTVNLSAPEDLDEDDDTAELVFTFQTDSPEPAANIAQTRLVFVEDTVPAPEESIAPEEPVFGGPSLPDPDTDTGEPVIDIPEEPIFGGPGDQGEQEESPLTFGSAGEVSDVVDAGLIRTGGRD